MELVYHYLWKNRMMGRRMMTVDGLPLEIVSPGRHNDDAGPDFSDARIIIDGERWAGNVEIHVKASDWYAHGHQNDPAYDSVILHAVAVDDRRLQRRDGTEIPQTVLAAPKDFYITYARLTEDLKGTRCRDLLPMLPPMVLTDWLETLAVERLHFKARRLLDYHEQLGGDWEQAVFTAVARGLGFGLNGLPFEMLAKSLPLRYVYHHADDLLQVEALLFGQAGFLEPALYLADEYYQSLCREYMFLSRKYALRPLRREIWKFSRTRPQNFPHRRIAMLARALHEGVRFASGLAAAAGDMKRLLDFFDWRLEGYWANHAGFGSQGECAMPRTLSLMSKELLIINVAAPFCYAHASLGGDYEAGERGTTLLMQLKPERNSKIDNWRLCGLEPTDALRSQALLHLRDEYCDRNRCLDCRFGHYFLWLGGREIMETNSHPNRVGGGV